MRDLRNIPESVILSLLQSDIYVDDFLESCVPLSEPVFEYLWNKWHGDLELAIKLVSRPLSEPQRTIVTQSERRAGVIRELIRYNVLSFAHLKALPLDMVTRVISYNALAYYEYETDSEVMEYLAIGLPTDVFICYQLRSSPERLSDDDVMAAATNFFSGVYLSDSQVVAGQNVHANAVRDLLETRPHLARKLAEIRDARVQLALAESRFATGAVLDTMLRKDHEKFTTTDANTAIGAPTAPVLAALARNLVVPSSLRIVCGDSSGVEWSNDLAYSVEVTVSPSFAEVQSRFHQDWILRRTLATSAPFNTLQDWDILELVKSPYLRRPSYEALLERLCVPYVNHRLGPARVLKAKRTLCDRLGDVLDHETVFATHAPRPDRYDDYQTSGPRALQMDKTVGFEFSVNAGAPKDASSLIEYLGLAPSAWASFIHALDLASPSTTIQKVLDTTKRLVLAP